MTTQDGISYEEQTRRLLAEAQSELAHVQSQMHDLEKKRDDLHEEIRGYQSALDGYLRRAGKPLAAQSSWQELLKTCTNHDERIQAIAKRKGGDVGISEVADILYTNGFIANKSTKRNVVYAMVYNKLSEMTSKGIFERVDKGTYRLVDAQQALPLQT